VRVATAAMVVAAPHLILFFPLSKYEQPLPHGMPPLLFFLTKYSLGYTLKLALGYFFVHKFINTVN
jgi:hypothetical protein